MGQPSLAARSIFRARLTLLVYVWGDEHLVGLTT